VHELETIQHNSDITVFKEEPFSSALIFTLISTFCDWVMGPILNRVNLKCPKLCKVNVIVSEFVKTLIKSDSIQYKI
jgi:hypothetical protein